MRLRIISAWMLLAFIVAPIAPTPARSDPTAFKQLDQKLVQALREPPSQRALDLFGDADQMLNAIHKQRQPQKGGATDLDVTVRASLIDSMRDVIALDMQKGVLESVRAQVKVLDLVRSLWEASAAKQAERTPELDQLVTAHYDRLAKTGAQDRNAAVSYGIPEGQKLLYRIFVQRDGGQLSAFELAGDKAQRKATWRETPLPARAGALLAKAGTIIGAPTAKKVLFPGNEYPFVLIVAGALADADDASEAKIADSFEKLPDHSIVPLMIEGSERKHPFTLVPAIAADVRSVLRGAAAGLFHRTSEAQLKSWGTVGSLRDLVAIAADAAAIAEEVSADLGRDKPSSTERPRVARLVDSLTPAAADSGSRPLAAIVTTDAAPVKGGRSISLKPDQPLVLKGKIPGTDWGQYGFGLPEKETLVWLRSDQVQLYSPPKPSSDLDKSTEPGRAATRPRTGSEPGAISSDSKKKAQ